MSTIDPKNSWKDIFAERLQLAIEQRGLTAESAATKMTEDGYKISAKMLRDYLGKISTPGAGRVLWFADFFGKSMDWFFGRERDAIRPPDLTIEKVPRLKTYGKFDRLALRNYLPIPLLKDSIAAGLPQEVDEDAVEGWVLIYASRDWMPHDAENYTCAHVDGDSMAPILQTGDIVAIDHSDREPANLHNKMVAFRTNGKVTVKWLRFLPDNKMIIGEPENQFMKDTTLYLRADEGYEQIVGRVAWWWAKR
jgi:transcriptional regulator with XRE-family HTH domain